MADVKQQDGTWFLNITDEGDDAKSVKTIAARRKVPVHPQLIQLGFLDFVASRRQGVRLFPDYSYSTNGGYVPAATDRVDKPPLGATQV